MKALVNKLKALLVLGQNSSRAVGQYVDKNAKIRHIIYFWRPGAEFTKDLTHIFKNFVTLIAL